MSWGRINHPSDMLKIDDQIEVMVLHVDKDREKIALGLKQKSASPWENVADKYPVGTRVIGEVVNVMSYGAFVKLEEGIEGLVHISEMSWTKRINHPSELVNIGDKIEVVVLGINKDKQEISLGMKQTQVNPWDQVAGKYPPGTMVEGTVRNLTNYGAFIEIEEGIDGLLHISDMSWTRKIGHPNELLEKGQRISCQVLNVDQDRKRIALGLKQLKEDPWETDIPGRYEPGDVVKGKVTKLTNFGVFVELEPGLEGLLHISELADHKVDSPEEVVKVGDEIEVKILRVDRGERKIGLSRKKAQWTKPGEEEGEAEGRRGGRGRQGDQGAQGRTGRRRPALQHRRNARLEPETEPLEPPPADRTASNITDRHRGLDTRRGSGVSALRSDSGFQFRDADARCDYTAGWQMSIQSELPNSQITIQESGCPHNPSNPLVRPTIHLLCRRSGFPKSLDFVYPQYILDFQVPLKLSKREVRYLVLWNRERQRGMSEMQEHRGAGYTFRSARRIPPASQGRVQVGLRRRWCIRRGESVGRRDFAGNVRGG